MRVIGYVLCMADQDLWMKTEVESITGQKYWSYVLCYVDDMLVIHHDSMSVLNRIGKLFKLKDDKNNGELDMCLGAKLRKTMLNN